MNNPEVHVNHKGPVTDLIDNIKITPFDSVNKAAQRVVVFCASVGIVANVLLFAAHAVKGLAEMAVVLMTPGL